MRFSIATVAGLALGVTAAPAHQDAVAPRAPEVTPALDERQWGGVTWATHTWGSVTWTQPATVSGTPVPTWSPQGNGWGSPAPSPCLTPAEATVVANNFRDTIASPFSAAFVDATFSSTFEDYSDSVIELENHGCNGPIALGSPTFSSLQSFIAGQGGQRPIPFTILNQWNTCDSVHFRWVSQPGPGGPANPQQQVTGIIALEVVPNPTPNTDEPWLIQTTYSEFNSGAWMYDLGIFVPTNCTAA